MEKRLKIIFNLARRPENDEVKGAKKLGRAYVNKVFFPKVIYSVFFYFPSA